MNVDLKRLYTSDTPKFRRGDTVIILFNFYDDGEEYDINSATKAQVHQKTSKGNIIVTDCTFEYYKGKRVVKFEVEDVAMVEFGYLNLLLTVYQGNDVISIQPFNVLVYDDYMGGASSFIDLIQELQKLIENMVIDLNNAIKLTEKGVANGVATLDANGKVPLKQLPAEFDALLEHITQTVFEHQVHGLKIDDDGLMMYKDKNGNWQYVGFSDTGVGGGTTDLLQAEITVKDGIAKVTYTGKPTVNISKWATGDRQVAYFLLNGTSFTGTTFPVSSLGIHTLYYKDSNGVEYVKVFNVTADMMGKPNVDIDVNDGFVTVTPPSNLGISIKKWAKGSHPVSYFAFNGTVFTGNTFEVTEVGTYTVYIKTTTGLEYVYEFEVTQDMLKPVDNTPPVITITKSTENWTKDNVTVKIKITDESAIRIQKYRIGYASEQDVINNGTNITSSTNSLTFNQNNHLSIYAEDIHGNKSFERFRISNIDKDMPTAYYNESYNGTTNISTITISASDYTSGIDYIQLPDNSKVYSSNATYTTSSLSDFIYKVADKAGNISSFKGSVKGSIVKIEYVSGALIVLYKNGDAYTNLVESTTGNPTEKVSQGSNWYRLAIRGVKDISVGQHHTILTTNSGRAYSTGAEANNNGQLGLGDKEPRNKFTMIPSLTNVTEVVAIKDASYFKSNGKWYGCGGSWGQFAVGNTIAYTTPTLIGTSPSGKIISDVHFGNVRALYKLSDGKLYGAGNNADNSLGFSHYQSNYQYPNLTESTSLNSLGTVKLFKIFQQTYVVLNNNSVYVTGHHQYKNPTKINGLPSGQNVSGIILDANLLYVVMSSGDVYKNHSDDIINVSKVSSMPSNIVYRTDTKGQVSMSYINSKDNKLYELDYDGETYKEMSDIPKNFTI